MATRASIPMRWMSLSPASICAACRPTRSRKATRPGSSFLRSSRKWAACMTSEAAPRAMPAMVRRIWTGRRDDMTVRREIQTRLPVRAGRSPGCRRARGFTYIGVLILVVMMGIALAAAGEVWYTAMKREKEQELLFIGSQFRLALEQYSAQSPGLGSRYPFSLEDLLQDPRQP